MPMMHMYTTNGAPTMKSQPGPCTSEKPDDEVPIKVNHPTIAATDSKSKMRRIPSDLQKKGLNAPGRAPI